MQHDNYSLKKSIKSEKLNWFIKKTSWIFIISGRFTHPLLIVDSRFSLLLHWKFVQLKRIGRFGNILWSLSKCAELSWFSSSILSSSVVYFLLIICLSYRRFLYLLLITDWYLTLMMILIFRLCFCSNLSAMSCSKNIESAWPLQLSLKTHLSTIY